MSKNITLSDGCVFKSVRRFLLSVLKKKFGIQNGSFESLTVVLKIISKFSIGHTGSSEGVSCSANGSKKDDYLVENDKFLICVPEDAPAFVEKFK